MTDEEKRLGEEAAVIHKRIVTAGFDAIRAYRTGDTAEVLRIVSSMVEMDDAKKEVEEQAQQAAQGRKEQERAGRAARHQALLDEQEAAKKARTTKTDKQKAKPAEKEKPTTVSLYTDGGCILRNPSPVGGTWAWCMVAEDESLIAWSSGVLRPEEGVDSGWSDLGPDGKYRPRWVVTNNVAELAAIVFALEALPDDWRATVYSDSQVSLLRVFNGAALNNVPAWLFRRLKAVQGRTHGRVGSRLLEGHPTPDDLARGKSRIGRRVSPFNVWCDEEARQQGRRHLAVVEGLRK